MLFVNSIISDNKDSKNLLVVCFATMQIMIAHREMQDIFTLVISIDF
jgi:hypothetical protein